jgi:hypothetical protein
MLGAIILHWVYNATPQPPIDDISGLGPTVLVTKRLSEYRSERLVQTAWMTRCRSAWLPTKAARSVLVFANGHGNNSPVDDTRARVQVPQNGRVIGAMNPTWTIRSS